MFLTLTTVGNDEHEPDRDNSLCDCLAHHGTAIGSIERYKKTMVVRVHYHTMPTECSMYVNRDLGILVNELRPE